MPEIAKLVQAGNAVLGTNNFVVSMTPQGDWHIEVDGIKAHEDRYEEIAALATAPEPADVIAERERRLGLGFDYDFGDERGVHRIGTSPSDMVGWDEVTKFANAMVTLGDTASLIPIETDTGPTAVTSVEWQSILIAAGLFRQPIWMASFTLQKMEPIPADYADDAYWPGGA